MMKWWNHQHSFFLQSFHIEIIALKTFRGNLSDYPQDVYRYFDKAVEIVRRPLSHDGNRVDSYLDSHRRKEAVKRLKTARGKALEAWKCTSGRKKDHAKAINLWRQIFGDKFPKHGR